MRSREDLSEWIHRQGFPQPRWGSHFSGRAQERILSIAAMTDSRVLLLQAMYVRLAMVECAQLPPPPPPPPPLAVPRQERPRRVAPETFPESTWSLLDDVNLTDMFQQRFTVLQSCPWHVRGRFLQANRKALETRHNAARTNDPVTEERAWKLFCLLPVWLLRRAPGDVRVSKEDLCRRFDLFAEGLWETLCDEAVAAITTSVPQKQRHERTDEERAMAACRKVQLGEVSRAR